MKKERKSLLTKIPPTAVDNYQIIQTFITQETIPKIQPLVKEIDILIAKSISNLQYAIKWGSIFYGTKELGWIIQVAPLAVSVNILFLNGAEFESPPPLGETDKTRYVKLKSLGDLEKYDTSRWIEEATLREGWK